MAAGGKRRSFYTDLDHMRNLFDSVDSTNTGFIGYTELCALVRNIPGIEEAAVPELMEQLDRDKDGKVRKSLQLTPNYAQIRLQAVNAPFPPAPPLSSHMST